MTKTLLLLTISVLLISCTQQEQKLSGTDEKQIRIEVQESFNSLVESTKVQDWGAYFDHFDQEHFTGLNADGTVWQSFEEFKESVYPVFQMIESSDSLEFPVVKISVIDKLNAVLVNEYTQTIELNGGQVVRASGGGTQVWSKKNGEWKLVSVSSSAKE